MIWRPASIAASSALIDFGRPDEQRDDHVREHHHVAQRQQRQRDRFGRAVPDVRTLETSLSQTDVGPESCKMQDARERL